MTLGPAFAATLSAARTGAEWAWTSLYRDLSPSLLRYLKARGSADPENVMGEVFVQVVRGLPGFEGGEPDFKAWLFTIARNRVLDDWRRNERRPHEVASPEPPAEAPLGAEAGAETQAPVPRLVQEVLDHLTAEQRDVLFLRVLAGLTLEETAQVLDKTTTSVKRLQARGLDSLRRKIASGVVSL